MLLKLRYNGPLSNFAFNFNLRRYTMAPRAPSTTARSPTTSNPSPARRGSPSTLAQGMAVQVDPVKPVWKAPGTKRLKLKHAELLLILLQFCFQFQLAPLQQAPPSPAAPSRTTPPWILVAASTSRWGWTPGMRQQKRRRPTQSNRQLDSHPALPPIKPPVRLHVRV